MAPIKAMSHDQPMTHLRSVLFFGLSVTILFAGSLARATVPTAVPELASVSTFEACAVGLGQSAPREVVKLSPFAADFLASFAKTPASQTSYQNSDSRIGVSITRSPATGLGCVVAIQGADRNAALKAVLKRAREVGSTWSSPVKRNYFGRSLWVSIDVSGSYLLMIPEVGSSDNDPVVIAGNDLGGRDVLAKSPDNTDVFVRAAMDDCAMWVASNTDVSVPLTNFENNPRVTVRRSLTPIRGCTVKALTADPPKTAARLDLKLQTVFPGIIALPPADEIMALGYDWVSTDCYVGKSGTYSLTITAAPLRNDDPFRSVTVSFLKWDGDCQGLAAKMMAR